MAATFRPGDPVVYRRPKTSTRPGRNAADVRPAPAGDTYSYTVPKYYRVTETWPDGAVVVRTRQGRLRTLRRDDPALRPARWWERLLLARRFPPPEGLA